jgi:NAD(P)-dependent dehydrogenase (short-subunit alcohol dehydrogenase family)
MPYLEGKVAVITGGSSGIGLAMIVALGQVVRLGVC